MRGSTGELREWLPVRVRQRYLDECRLAEYALKVEHQKAEQMMTDAGYDAEGGLGDDSPFARQMSVFQQYAETFTRRIAAIERALEDRRDLP